LAGILVCEYATDRHVTNLTALLMVAIGGGRLAG